jgi:alpha-ketoglutarate-dependent taurine dioxygenase
MESRVWVRGDRRKEVTWPELSSVRDKYKESRTSWAQPVCAWQSSNCTEEDCNDGNWHNYSYISRHRETPGKDITAARRGAATKGRHKIQNTRQMNPIKKKEVTWTNQP